MKAIKSPLRRGITNELGHMIVLLIDRESIMKYGILISCLLLIAGCANTDEETTTPDLLGRWVNVATTTDTLSFERLDGSDIINLQRGTEVRDGLVLPRAGSGPYSYELREKEILLNWMLSSNSAFESYYFEAKGKQLEIGDFYGPDPEERLTFERIN
ncbi:MAG: hypothetical protein AAGA85_18730 [Bacteroidota bacterium]